MCKQETSFIVRGFSSIDCGESLMNCSWIVADCGQREKMDKLEKSAKKAVGKLQVR